jgi:hypothetical protein
MIIDPGDLDKLEDTVAAMFISETGINAHLARRLATIAMTVVGWAMKDGLHNAMKALSSRFDEKQVEAIVLAKLIKPILAGHEPHVQGATVAELMATFVASHAVPGNAQKTKKLRARIMTTLLVQAEHLIPGEDHRLTKIKELQSMESVLKLPPAKQRNRKLPQP